MDPKGVAQTGLVGWRKQVADKAAEPLAERTPLSADQARAVFGLLFFGLSAYYVIGTIRRAVSEASG